MRTLFLLVYISGAAAAPLSFFGVGDWGAPDPLLQDRVASSMAATADAMATPPASISADKSSRNFSTRPLVRSAARRTDTVGNTVVAPAIGC